VARRSRSFAGFFAPLSRCVFPSDAPVCSSCRTTRGELASGRPGCRRRGRSSRVAPGSCARVPARPPSGNSNAQSRSEPFVASCGMGGIDEPNSSGAFRRDARGRTAEKCSKIEDLQSRGVAQPGSAPALGEYNPTPSLPSRSAFFLTFSSIRGFCSRSRPNPNGLKTIGFCDSFATAKSRCSVSAEQMLYRTPRRRVAAGGESPRHSSR
jgi:hypothetical protein